MKKKTVLAATLAAAGAIAAAPFAAAETGPQIHEIGQQADLVNGDVTQGWTVTGLMPSSDPIPYQVRGTLWETTATDQAISGSAQPIVSNFNARAANGETYRSLWTVATPQGVNPATLAPGQKTTGKVYFDVTGAQPDSVVYNDGARDVLLWLKPAVTPATSGSSGSSGWGSGSGSAASYPSTSGTPAATGAAAPAATGAEAAVPGTPTPASAELAPAPAGSVGTPLPAGSVGTPIPAGSAGTPIPAGRQGTPLPPPAAPAPPPPPAAPAPMPISNAEQVPVPHGQSTPTTTPVPLP